MGHVLGEAEGTTAILRYKGVFDYYKFINFVLTWLRKRGYNVLEKTYKHKMSCPHGFELEWDIQSSRKVTPYIMYHIDMAVFLWDAFEVDAIKNGKKVKLWNARMEVRTSFKVELDYLGKWETSGFREKLRNFFDEYVIKKEIVGKYVDQLYYTCVGFHTEQKKFLDMEAKGNVYKEQ